MRKVRPGEVKRPSTCEKSGCKASALTHTTQRAPLSWPGTELSVRCRLGHQRTAGNSAQKHQDHYKAAHCYTLLAFKVDWLRWSLQWRTVLLRCSAGQQEKVWAVASERWMGEPSFANYDSHTVESLSNLPELTYLNLCNISIYLTVYGKKWDTFH